MNKYILIDYFDVWGDEIDGWEVNDSCTIADNITISDEATDKEIIDYLVDVLHWISPEYRDMVYLDDCYGEMIEIYYKTTDMPLGSLRLIN